MGVKLAGFVAALLLCTTSCAKSPPGGASSLGPQLIISMSVAGNINPSFYYFVVFNTSNDPTGAVGPDPAIAPTYANGFVTGSATQFVEYSGTQPGDGYAIYQFTPGTNLAQHSAVGLPPQDTPIVAGTSQTLEFRIPLSDLTVNGITASEITNLQINMIATDRLPGPEDTSPKYFDAFGDSSFGSGQLNDYITIATSQATTYSNATRNIEPTGDVQQTNGSGGYSTVGDGQPIDNGLGNSSDLDINGWSVQVVQ